jgi:hypothetical protein
VIVAGHVIVIDAVIVAALGNGNDAVDVIDAVNDAQRATADGIGVP